MSTIAGLPRIQEKGNQKSFHHRHNSGELDVFEAAGYFSGSNEIHGTRFTPQTKMIRSSGRMSLDIPVMSSKRSSVPAPTHHHHKVTKDEKKLYKQPNSPGGKFASFLNSLFNQTSSKTKKSSTQSMKDDQDHEIGRRKLRRSSISHFQSVSTTSSSNCNSSESKSSNSFYSSSSKTPTKISSKDFHNVQASLKKVHIDEKTAENYSWLDEERFKFRSSNELSSEKNSTFVNNEVSGDKINQSNDEDDGADSDSSSDLFELQNYDLVSCYSSDLPVYETTHINAIKRGAPIASSVM